MYLGAFQPVWSLPEALVQLPSVHIQLARGQAFGIGDRVNLLQTQPVLPSLWGLIENVCVYTIEMWYFFVYLWLLGGIPAWPSSAWCPGNTDKCTYPTGRGLDLWHQHWGQPFSNLACSAHSLGPDWNCVCIYRIEIWCFFVCLRLLVGVPARPSSASLSWQNCQV